MNDILKICKECGAKCCKGPSPTITIFDIIRILKYLKEGPESISKYFEVYTHDFYLKEVLPKRFNMRLSEETLSFLDRRIGDLLRQLVIVKLRKLEDNRCIFLTDDLTCSIYPVRPMACRAYPLKIQGPDENCLLIKRGIELTYEKTWLRQYVDELVKHYDIILRLNVNSIDRLINVVSIFWNAIT